MIYSNFYLDRLLLCIMIFSFFCVQTLPLPAVELIGKEMSQLNHPAAKLIEKKAK